MEQSHITSNYPNKSLLFKKYFQKNVFDDDFLDEKDKALSPFVLSDEIPGEVIKKSKKIKRNKIRNFSVNKENDIKYGSNIVYIDSKIDDNGEESYQIMNEQISKIMTVQKFCKKSPYGRRIRKKI